LDDYGCPITPTTPSPDGADGIGDPYLPTAGGTGYDVRHYQIALTIDPETGAIAGTTTVTLSTLTPVSQIHLDLIPRVSDVRVDDSAASSYIQSTSGDLMIDVRDDARGLPRARGETLRITVTYAGMLDPEDPMQAGSVYRLENEWLLAEEPQGALLWFPVNDHPRDPATYHISVTVPAGVEAISAGVLESEGPSGAGGGQHEWVWSIDSATVSYAVPLAIGQYRLDRSTESIGGRDVQYLSAVTERVSSIAPMSTNTALKWLRETTISEALYLVEVLGEYPASALGGIIPPQQTDWGALETWGRPVYDPSVARYQGQGYDMSYIVRHEQAHFWFGDTVTLCEWNDIVINEGLADYFDGYLGPGTTRASADEYFRSVYASLSRASAFWEQIISDPGPTQDLIFSDQVYTRGGMAMHATRVLMGDEAFFRFLRDWVANPGPRSLEQWREMAQQYTPVDLSAAHRAWFDVGEMPAATSENGYPT
jgi:aminopeptidase N